MEALQVHWFEISSFIDLNLKRDYCCFDLICFVFTAVQPGNFPRAVAVSCLPKAIPTNLNNDYTWMCLPAIFFPGLSWLPGIPGPLALYMPQSLTSAKTPRPWSQQIGISPLQLQYGADQTLSIYIFSWSSSTKLGQLRTWKGQLGRIDFLIAHCFQHWYPESELQSPSSLGPGYYNWSCHVRHGPELQTWQKPTKLASGNRKLHSDSSMMFQM